MKICMITDAWKPVWGGGQEHVFQVSKILKEKYGCEVDIIAPTLIFKEFNFNNFLHRVLFTLWTLQFYLNSDYDIYHSHSFSTDAFLPLAKLRGKKTAVTIHGVGGNLIGGGILNTLGIMKLFMWLVLDIWVYDFKFSAGKYKTYKVVGNGVDVTIFDAVKPQKDKSKFRIFWIGRKYDLVKGVRYLEEAVAKINNPKIELDIAQQIYGIDKIKRFKRADLFVLPSLSEGLPLVVLEAMAAKLPVVATEVGDLSKVVIEGKTGFLVQPGDVNALAKGIKKAFDSKNLEKMGLNGYSLVKRKYTWEKVTEFVYKTYESSCNNC